MKGVKTEEPYAPVPYHPTPVYQQTSHNHYGLCHDAAINFLRERTMNVSGMAMTPQPEPPSRTCQYYGEAQNYCLTPLPVGFSEGCPAMLPCKGTQNLLSMAMRSTEAPQLPLRTHRDRRKLDGPQTTLPGTSGDLTACQLSKTSSSLPQGVAGDSKSTNTLQKRELRLMKNREAARECRRKKKEYVKCLENRVAVLENQNKTLIEELRALKDIYRHKVE
ncbi:cyclic AMP-dependent transcription factor ATF-1-like isoform X2 [Centropristis striata]|uniref:cyclic AMP-dependent transcription factor ATF-1-like isoform X2 n=1 Tax=Centropristis striata TaxID=184440 RepID=UPI0027E18E63|nr:cyclic AMP-dependent transcription factor ATF-1-like isoform X2 [Centropristis striata]